MKRLLLTLHENAISFAEDALSNAMVADENPLRWKFAILTLVQSIELTLKELLYRQHPFLIYLDIDKPNITVNIEKAIQRLKKIAGIEITDDDNKALKTAIEARNNIVHHSVDESFAELKLLFSRLLGFLNEFHAKHLGSALHDKLDDELWRNGLKIKEYGEEIFRRAKIQIEKDSIDLKYVISCPMCGWNALSVYGPKENTCYVCGWTEKLLICKKCNKIMFEQEYEQSEGEIFCYDCMRLISDDYWYEQSIGK